MLKLACARCARAHAAAVEQVTFRLSLAECGGARRAPLVNSVTVPTATPDVAHSAYIVERAEEGMLDHSMIFIFLSCLMRERDRERDSI